MDADTWLAYYLFVNHGVLPGQVERMEPRERALAFQMARKEIKARPKK